MQLQSFDAREALIEALVAHLHALIESAVAARGQAVLALSGGSTPIPVYAAIAQHRMDWPKVRFVLVDERWVDADHPASNETALRHALAPALAAGASLVGMKTPHATAGQGLDSCLARYRTLAMPFDVVLLGMGEDGHTASLFPHAVGLMQALAAEAPPCAVIHAQHSAVTGANTERMTLTLPAIINTREIILLITGEGKQRVLEQALGDGAVEAMPVRALLQQVELPLVVWSSP